MKGITAIKRNLIKLLKENNYKDCTGDVDFPKLSDTKVFYVTKYPHASILSIQVENGLSFHFGYDKITKTSASICIEGEQFDTEYFLVKYWKIAEQCIKLGADKDYVKRAINIVKSKGYE